MFEPHCGLVAPFHKNKQPWTTQAIPRFCAPGHREKQLLESQKRVECCPWRTIPRRSIEMGKVGLEPGVLSAGSRIFHSPLSLPLR